MNSSIRFALKKGFRPFYRQLRQMEFWLRNCVGRFQPEEKIAEDAQDFWNTTDPRIRQYSHWRGSGVFANQERWLCLGEEHLRLYDEFARMLGIAGPLKRVVE